MRHLDDFTGRFVSHKRVAQAGGECLVFGAHGGGVNFDKNPIFLGARHAAFDDARLLFCLHHGKFH